MLDMTACRCGRGGAKGNVEKIGRISTQQSAGFQQRKTSQQKSKSCSPSEGERDGTAVFKYRKVTMIMPCATAPFAGRVPNTYVRRMLSAVSLRIYTAMLVSTMQNVMPNQRKCPSFKRPNVDYEYHYTSLPHATRWGGERTRTETNSTSCFSFMPVVPRE
jgi:hypothetical protein